MVGSELIFENCNSASGIAGSMGSCSCCIFISNGKLVSSRLIELAGPCFDSTVLVTLEKIDLIYGSDFVVGSICPENTNWYSYPSRPSCPNNASLTPTCFLTPLLLPAPLPLPSPIPLPIPLPAPAPLVLPAPLPIPLTQAKSASISSSLSLQPSASLLVPPSSSISLPLLAESLSSSPQSSSKEIRPATVSSSEISHSKSSSGIPTQSEFLGLTILQLDETRVYTWDEISALCSSTCTISAPNGLSLLLQSIPTQCLVTPQNLTVGGELRIDVSELSDYPDSFQLCIADSVQGLFSEVVVTGDACLEVTQVQQDSKLSLLIESTGCETKGCVNNVILALSIMAG